MFDMKHTILLLLVLATLASASAAEAATYYVATTGNNSNTCAQAQNVATPKQTIAAGISCMAAGDTVQVRAGSYHNQTIQGLPAGSDSAYSIVRNYPGERPIIGATSSFVRGVQMNMGASHHWEIRGFDFSGTAGSQYIFECVEMFGAAPADYPHHLRFIDNKCHDTVNVGFLWYGNTAGTQGTDHYIAQNEWYNIGIGSPGYPPGMNTIYGTGSRTIVEDNVFHNVVNGVAIWTAGYVMNDVIVRRNICYDLFRPSIDPWEGSSGGTCIAHTASGGRTKIYNNIIYRSGESADSSAIYINNGPNDIKIFNNTVYNLLHPNAEAVDANNASNVVCRNNIARQTGGFVGCNTASNNLTTDPLFMNAANGNFHLLSGSPAIDAGQTLTDVLDDFDKITRPQGSTYDIGAFEVVNGSGPAMLPPTGLTAQ